MTFEQLTLCAVIHQHPNGTKRDIVRAFRGYLAFDEAVILVMVDHLIKTGDVDQDSDRRLNLSRRGYDACSAAMAKFMPAMRLLCQD